MNRDDASHYRCPASGAALELVVENEAGDDVEKGFFRSPEGLTFTIEGGIPDFTYPKELPAADASAREIYDTVADVYDEYLPLTFMTFNADETALRERMVDRMRIPKGGRVLEVGAGTGRTSAFISKALGPTGHVFVHDISRVILEKAVENLAAEEVRRSFLVGNAVYLPFPDNHFDAIFHFGGLNMFSDVPRALSEMARVVRRGGRVVVGDESMPPWLRSTEYGRVLMNSNKHYEGHLPLEHIPVEARDVTIEYILGETFYLLSFTVDAGAPQANLDFQIPGARGGTHRTRYYGNLEGVTPEAKELAKRARERSGISMHQWLDRVVKEAAKRDLGE